MENTKQYTAINASAGSGKTYALVLRVLMICLRYERQHDAIKHILALTFTNKAANEMKERILQWLKNFTKPDYENNGDLKNIQTALRGQGIMVTLEDLHRRSQKVLDYILHNYSTLSIGTIDKFNARLVRSFSYELGLAHQFNLEIQSEPFLIEAVDKMLDEIGENEQISEAFMDFINYNLDNDERVNLNHSLYKKAKNFISDIHYEDLKKNSEFDWQSYEKAKTKLRQEILKHRITAKETAQNIITILKEKGLEISDFAGGNSNSIAKFFYEYLKFINGKRDAFPFPADEEKAIQNFRKGTSGSGKGKEQLVDEVLNYMIESRESVISNFISAERKSAILSELLPLKINKEIQEKLNEIEEENDLVLLSKFNVIINENLRNEPSSFIYEKIGTRYQHFFFDEFQDTSKMQWNNLLPLKDHTVASEGNSFTLVGDPKQSIYRFRGGDSELMLNVLNKKDESPVEVFVEVLGSNWRSAKNIVNFNNELYDFLSKGLNTEHCELFSEKARQIPQKKFTGRVKVNLAPYTKGNEEYFTEVAGQMHRNIQECLNNGFIFSDITILCRSAKEIQKYAQLLGREKVIYNGTETYIKTISEKGLTLDLSYTLKALIEFLNWEIQPKNRQFMVKMLYYLNELGRIDIPEFSNEIMPLLKIENHEKLINTIEERFSLKLNQKGIPRLNLYNYIEFFVHEFSVKNKETDYLLNFLENLYNFTQNAGMTVKDFVKLWDEEAHKISIQASENVDAVNMMTIHAAKGLEFPVVFLPMKNANKDAEFHEWFDLENLGELKSVNIKGFKKEMANYDRDLASFNEENSYKNKIDRFCIQYVATTRPVEQLFLYIQRPSASSNNLEIFDFIKTKNPENLDEFDIYPEENESFKKQRTEETADRKTLDITSLSENTEHISNIKIATPSKSYQNTNESVRIGIFVHEILEKINSEKDIENVLQQYILEGIITENEKVEIVERLLKVLRNERYAQYFDETLKMINEKEMMITENGSTETYRIDRLVETENGLVIIDFKTGAEREKYEKQVSAYREVLEKLGKKVAGIEIIYV